MMDKLLIEVSAKIEALEFENKELRKQLEALQKADKAGEELLAGCMSTLSGLTPMKVYHSKKRGNTTVTFLDGSSVRVHLIDGDEDCLETALAFALCKKMWPRDLFKALVKNAVEVDECKKD